MWTEEQQARYEAYMAELDAKAARRPHLRLEDLRPVEDRGPTMAEMNRMLANMRIRPDATEALAQLGEASRRMAEALDIPFNAIQASAATHDRSLPRRVREALRRRPQ